MGRKWEGNFVLLVWEGNGKEMLSIIREVSGVSGAPGQVVPGCAPLFQKISSQVDHCAR